MLFWLILGLIVGETALVAETFIKERVLPAPHSKYGMKSPVDFDIDAQGTIYYIERAGLLGRLRRGEKESTTIGKFDTFVGYEEGLLAVSLQTVETIQKLFLFRSLPETFQNEQGQRAGKIRVSHFTLTEAGIDLNSEQIVIEIEVQREECCHSGGGMAFDPEGHLFIGTGDNTSPFYSDGYSPLTERIRSRDAQATSANSNSLLGKILRIKPKLTGGYTVPEGNLYGAAMQKSRPEIYISGVRNPYRLSIDPVNKDIYWGDPGPDAKRASTRGPRGGDEINRATGPGFFGWPYYLGTNEAYRVETPLSNTSSNNTGVSNLPNPQGSLLFYSNEPHPTYPVLGNGGGCTAMTGPIYIFNIAANESNGLPEKYDRHLFFYDWSRNWICLLRLNKDGGPLTDPDGQLEIIRFAPELRFKRPIKLMIGPDFCLYVLEYGSSWGVSADSALTRVKYIQ
ncbi:MAG: PQQ-dependent sugar dehydrogenase [Verrucomicrobiota bacterium]|nr:PQQ-dependent sugar dehydrogenase [Verrucomicrobiota bacterium]